MSEEVKKETTVSGKFQDIVAQIEKMSVLDLSELVKVLEEKFGVSAAAPVMVAQGAVTQGVEEKAEEKTTFDVELTNAGTNKIGVIKAVREVVQLGLKEAKDLVEGAPKMVKEGVSKDAAAQMKAKLEAAGAQVTVK